jgi:hypothetical protein
VDGAVGEWRSEGVVHAAMLVDQRQAVELRADDGDLEVISPADGASAKPIYPAPKWAERA